MPTLAEQHLANLALEQVAMVDTTKQAAEAITTALATMTKLDPDIQSLIALRDALPEGSMSKNQLNNVITVHTHAPIAMGMELDKLKAILAKAPTP